jgi:3'(2'), 5'-bisphosphate nucleotidase
MVDGDVKVGVLGCPNLPVDDSAPLSADAGEHQTDEEGRGFYSLLWKARSDK